MIYDLLGFGELTEPKVSQSTEITSERKKRSK